MDWSNERYVRIYTRKTVRYIMYPWQTRAIRDLIFKELDRAGVMDLGGYEPVDAIGAAILMPREVVEAGLPPLFEDGTLVRNGDQLVAPNYIPAQEAAQSDKARAKASREKRRAVAAKQPVTDCDEPVTDCDTTSRNTTEPSHGVTPCRAVLNRAVPCSTERDEPNPSPIPTEDDESGARQVISAWDALTGGAESLSMSRWRPDAIEVYQKCKMVGVSVATVVENWLADAWVKETSPGLSHLAKQFQKYSKPNGGTVVNRYDDYEADMDRAFSEAKYWAEVDDEKQYKRALAEAKGYAKQCGRDFKREMQERGL